VVLVCQLKDQWKDAVQQSKAEAGRLREKLIQSEAEQRELKSTVENLKRQMCESSSFVCHDSFFTSLMLRS